MPLQSTGWAPRAEQDVLPHPTDLLLAALGSGRGRDGSHLCPLRSQSGKVAEAHEPSEALPSGGTPLQAISMDILGPLPRTERGKRFLLVITDRFSNLTAVVPLRTTNAYSVAIAICEAWIFKYGPPESVLTDNGKQFASRFFQSVCDLLGLSNVYTSAYHPQVNGQEERYNRTLQNMLMCFVEEHQDSWDTYATALTYAYNSHVHRTTGTRPFDLTLSRPPPAFSLHRSLRDRPELHSRDRHEFLIALDEIIAGAYNRLKKAQARYKKNFDKRVRRTNVKIGPEEYVFIDPTDGSKKKGKLQSPAEGPYRVQQRSDRTFTIDRKGATEVINPDRVAKAPRPQNAPRPHNAPAFVPEPGQLNNVTDGPEYNVQKILKHRVAAEDDQFEFFIKWADYEGPRWTKRDHVPEELISGYFRRRHRRSARATRLAITRGTAPDRS